MFRFYSTFDHLYLIINYLYAIVFHYYSMTSTIFVLYFFHMYSILTYIKLAAGCRLPIQNIKLAVGCRMPVASCRFSCRLPIQNIKLAVGCRLPIQMPVADSVADSKLTIYGPK